MKWTKLSERIIFIDNKNAVAERDKTAEYYSNGIKVRVVYPDSVNDTSDSRKSTECMIFSSVQPAARRVRKILIIWNICRKCNNPIAPDG